MSDASTDSGDGESIQPEQQPSERPRREINFRHSAQFVPILQHLGSSLLVSTYAAGKVATVGSGPEGLRLGFSNFQRAMGVAVCAEGIAIGGPNLIWILRDAGQLSQQIAPVGQYDRGFLARESFVTGNISVHEMSWGAGGELWVVNTLFSCLCTLHEDFNFVPRWQPSFITELAAQDRCHLNGMAMQDGNPKYVSALGTSDEARGWREGKSNGGVIIDVESGEIVASGFCMPHSPRIHQGRLFLLDSGRGQLVTVGLQSGQIDTVTQYPGYGRGMALLGQFAFIGMSKARETSVFGGVPICEDRSKMRCGVVVVDLVSGQSVAYLEFQTGVEEIFDVQVLCEVKNPIICGPYPVEDEQVPVWVVPNPSQIDDLIGQSRLGTVSRRLC